MRARPSTEETVLSSSSGAQPASTAALKPSSMGCLPWVEEASSPPHPPGKPNSSNLRGSSALRRWQGAGHDGSSSGGVASGCRTERVKTRVWYADTPRCGWSALSRPPVGSCLVHSRCSCLSGACPPCPASLCSGIAYCDILAEAAQHPARSLCSSCSRRSGLH